jgi:hypothetical protein
MRSRALILILATAALAGVAAPAAPAAAAGFVARLHAPTHHPRADRDWVVSVSARTPSGRALRATAFYEFLFDKQVVSTQYPDPHGPPHQRPWAFTGRFSDAVVWPRRAVGIPLTFRVVVRVRGRGTVNLDYRVRVRR